jgi:hypothetical protein
MLTASNSLQFNIHDSFPYYPMQCYVHKWNSVFIYPKMIHVALIFTRSSIKLSNRCIGNKGVAQPNSTQSSDERQNTFRALGFEPRDVYANHVTFHFTVRKDPCKAVT